MGLYKTLYDCCERAYRKEDEISIDRNQRDFFEHMCYALSFELQSYHDITRYIKSRLYFAYAEFIIDKFRLDADFVAPKSENYDPIYVDKGVKTIMNVVDFALDLTLSEDSDSNWASIGKFS